MEDTLISFETAKLAKEKGFNIPQNKVYVFGKEMFGYIDRVKFLNGDKQECSSNPHDWNNTKSSTSTKYYSVPTQSLLVKWLREVHNIIIDVKLDFFNSYNKESIKYYPIFYTYSDSKKRFWLYTDYINSDECTEEIQDKMPIFQKYSTYEEALEIGLQEALKLIK